MTDEEKKNAETAKAEAEAKAKAEKEKADAEFESSLDGLSDEEKQAKRDERAASHNDKGIDYEAEWKKEREARESAEKALAEKRFKDSKRKRENKGDDDEGNDDEDKPLTKKELAEVLENERQANQKLLAETQLDSYASKLATSDAEKRLIIEIFRNRRFPSHLSLQEQLEECYAIANRKKLVGERDEAMRALKGKSGINNDAAGTHHDSPDASEPQLAPQDKAAVNAVGVSFNPKTKRYEKTLKNGDIFVWDSKTKKSYILKKAK